MLLTLADFLVLEVALGTPPFMPIDCLLDDGIGADVTAAGAVVPVVVVVVAPPVYSYMRPELRIELDHTFSFYFQMGNN